ncbi:MAG TPA: extracellular solute-binding protein [Rhodopila sp.]|uniref:extracellular solute-binding protein n=1 Tax=Rhodopila sp. TaxID=2480087 RepID=UPI002CBA0AFB|nr:extracellular solute-binding protein [Rhodopila sp.]HVY15017.1 extracellular solute-binding protein [Rhodopila sp.]
MGAQTRRFILGAAALLLMGGGAAKAADLVVGAFGGVWEQSLKKCIIAPFEKKTGKTVDVVLGSPLQWLNQIAANKDKPPIDVIYNATETSYVAADRGLIDTFTPQNVPNIALEKPEFQHITDGYGAVHNYGAMGIIYNSKTVKDPPKTWKEFVDGTIAGKWKAMMPTVTYPSGGLTISVWWFAKLYGGDVNNIEPGLKEIKKMRDSGNLSFWFDPNTVLNALKSGDIDMALYWDGRAYSFIDDGNPDFKYISPKPGVVVAMTWIQKIKNGSPLGYEFANMALNKEAQSCFGSAIRYGIANKDATFDPKVANEITPTSELIFPPYRKIGEIQGQWIERWNKEIGR